MIFSGWSNEQLDAIAGAIYAAEGEGAYGEEGVCRGVAEALRDEATPAQQSAIFNYGVRTDPGAWAATLPACE